MVNVLLVHSTAIARLMDEDMPCFGWPNRGRGLVAVPIGPDVINQTMVISSVCVLSVHVPRLLKM